MLTVECDTESDGHGLRVAMPRKLSRNVLDVFGIFVILTHADPGEKYIYNLLPNSCPQSQTAAGIWVWVHDILYTRALGYSLGALLAQENDEEKEVALYYLNYMLVGVEYRYSPVEKECVAMMFAMQKLRYYLLSNIVYLISWINLLKVLVTKASSLNAQLTKWSIVLS